MENFLYIIKKVIPQPIFNIFAPVYHLLFSYVAAVFYRHPSRSMIVIGIVGTNGKTSVVEITSQILAEAGFKIASISSLYFTVLGERQKNMFKMTMPGRFKLQQFLHKAKNKGATHVILEATSEGIAQFRHKNIAWDVLIFTNLSPEHIESHGNFEKYQKTKEKIFAGLSKTYRKPEVPKVIIINGDDKYSKNFLEYKADRKYIYGLNKEFTLGAADLITPSAYSVDEEGLGFTIEGRDFYTKLSGEFNLYNVLGSIACVRAFGVPWEKIKKSVEQIEVIPGRMEYIQKNPFVVIVDYAHTPDALSNVYKTLQGATNEKREARMICVLGSAGGGRDKWKRPEMGRIAGEFCDEIILTNEDPYNEEPISILKDIEKGFSGTIDKKIKYQKIIDRREAIRVALKSAKQGDVIIITGKGAEPWIMIAGNKKIPWDDRKVIREGLKGL